MPKVKKNVFTEAQLKQELQRCATALTRAHEEDLKQVNQKWEKTCNSYYEEVHSLRKIIADRDALIKQLAWYISRKEER